MEEKLGAEIFDVDHTITRNITSLSYLLLLIKSKVFSITILRHIPYICMNYKFGHMAAEHFDRHFDEMVGVEQSFLDELAIENFNNMMKKEKVYGDAKRYIDHLKSGGKKIILATSSMETIIKPLADYLGVDAIIATKFAFKDGKCLGRFEGKPAFREEKRRKVLEFIKDNNIDLASSSFYSDSIHDYPLFMEVGNPVAVNPDLRLTLCAKKHGWPILKFR